MRISFIQVLTISILVIPDHLHYTLRTSFYVIEREVEAKVYSIQV